MANPDVESRRRCFDVLGLELAVDDFRAAAGQLLSTEATADKRQELRQKARNALKKTREVIRGGGVKNLDADGGTLARDLLATATKADRLLHWFTDSRFNDAPEALIGERQRLRKLLDDLDDYQAELWAIRDVLRGNFNKASPEKLLVPIEFTEPKYVRCGNLERETERKPYLLLRFMADKTSVEIPQCCPDVWADEPSTDAVKAAIRKANSLLQTLQCGETLNQSDGCIFWKNLDKCRHSV